MKGKAFKRSPRPSGTFLQVFFQVLALTILPRTLRLDGLTKQDGLNWFHLYENTVARIFLGHHTVSISVGYKLWLYYSDWKVIKDYSGMLARLILTIPLNIPPSTQVVAGDSGNPLAPTYTDFQKLLDPVAAPVYPQEPGIM